MSTHRGPKDIIAFLVQRKFPPTVVGHLPTGSRPNGSTTLGRMVRHEQMDQYRSELQTLPLEQLQSLYEEESSKALADLQRQEEQRFFNQPHAVADFDHWSKAEHWSLDEAIALAMGKAPEVVSWDKIRSYSSVSPFVQRYARLRDLADRAKFWKKLFDPVLPTIFLRWAKDNEIEVPPTLSERVEKLKGKIVDWKERCAKLQADYDQLDTLFDSHRKMYDKHVADWKEVVDKKLVLIEAATRRIAELESELGAAKAAPPSAELSKAPSLIERQNMLKAIFGMAVRGYSYNPTDKRSKTIAEIVSDLELEGLPLSDDTIRRYLKEARELSKEWQGQED